MGIPLVFCVLPSFPVFDENSFSSFFFLNNEGILRPLLLISGVDWPNSCKNKICKIKRYFCLLWVSLVLISPLSAQLRSRPTLLCGQNISLPWRRSLDEMMNRVQKPHGYEHKHNSITQKSRYLPFSLGHQSTVSPMFRISRASGNFFLLNGPVSCKATILLGLNKNVVGHEKQKSRHKSQIEKKRNTCKHFAI